MAPIERKSVDISPLRSANVPIVFIVGGPGSGKGTQCKLIADKFGFTHLSSGDLLRAEVESGSQLGKQLDAIMKTGQLVPLETVLDLLKEAMVKAFLGGSKGFLVDGYPRDINQGKVFEDEVMPSKLVIFFDANEETLVKRLTKRGETSGRADDNEKTIRLRLRTYNESTKPVVDYYRGLDKLVTINAEGTIEDVFGEVRKHLLEFQIVSEENEKKRRLRNRLLLIAGSGVLLAALVGVGIWKWTTTRKSAH